MLPQFRFNEVASFIAGGLQDFSISRAGQPWGIPLPWDESQVAYVWADALVNYLSALTYARPGEDLREKFWPAAHHLMAKDILRFHCVYWPAMLLAAGYEVPRQIFVHGYLLLDDKKISKSLGNVVDPLDLIDVYGADPFRYWCARAVTFGQDGSASIEGIARALRARARQRLRQPALAHDRDDRALPRGPAPGRPGRLVGDRRRDRLGAEGARLDRFDITGAIDRIWSLVRALNRHVTETNRGSSQRTRRNAAQLDQVLYDLCDGLRVARSRSPPTCRRRRRRSSPRSASRRSSAGSRSRTGRLAPAMGSKAAPPLFPRIEQPDAGAA